MALNEIKIKDLIFKIEGDEIYHHKNDKDEIILAFGAGTDGEVLFGKTNQMGTPVQPYFIDGFNTGCKKFSEMKGKKYVWNSKENSKKEPAGFIYIFEHRIITKGTVEILEASCSKLKIHWYGMVDIGWDEEYDMDVPFDATFEVSILSEKQKLVVEEYKKATMKPCRKLFLVDEKKDPITPLNSSIGGIPFLPIGEQWPTDKDGEKMPLFIQLVLKDTKVNGFPNKGLLQVFLSNNGKYPTEYKVCHRVYPNFPEVCQKDLKPLEKNIWIRKPLRIKHTAAESILPLYPEGDAKLLPIYNKIMEKDFVLEDRDYDDEEDYKKIADAIRDYIPQASYGGYGDTTQCEEFDYDNNEILIKIDSNLSRDIIIGDSGILWVKISKEDLKAGKIENSKVDWDCC